MNESKIPVVASSVPVPPREFATQRYQAEGGQACYRIGRAGSFWMSLAMPLTVS